MNHDVNGSGDCAQCANPDLKGLHSCERYSMRSRLGQASAEPTFSYANGALDDAETLQRRAHESAVRQAIASEAAQHQWEHKQLLTWVCICGASGPGLALPAAHAACRGVQERAYRNAVDGRARESRRFTREEVLTVLSAERAAAAPGTVDEGVLNRLIHIFKRME